MPSGTLLKTLQDALVEGTSASRDTHVVGNFVAMLHPTESLIYMNYAVPLAIPTSTSVAELIAHFRSKDRVPRLEFFADLWPEVISALVAAGFECEKTAPVMVLDRSGYVPVPYEAMARAAQPEDVAAMREVASIAFGMESSDDQDGRSRELLASGRMLGAVAGTDDIVACGVAIGTETVREVAGIATLPNHRRRGAATAVVHCLLDQFFHLGGEVAWLTPGDDGAEDLYYKIGFRIAGTQVNYVLPGVE